MGTAHSSHTNIMNNCTSFEGGANGCKACFGDSLEVSMGYTNKENDHTESWGANYKIGKKLEHSVDYILRARHDANGVVNINVGLGDHANNRTDFVLDITRVGCDGLRGGITGIGTSGSYFSKICAKQGYTLETTFVSYDCSFRDALFILQLKRRNNSENAYMVTMVHYYVTKTVALRVRATICRSRGRDFVVEVKGPFRKTGADLRRDIDEARRRHRIGSPRAKSSAKAGDSNSSFNSNNTIGQNQIVQRASNTGLINSTGSTNGSLNNSIFIDCKFP